MARGFDIDAARRTLARRDPALAAWMRRIDTPRPQSRWRQPLQPVDALASAILYQQLSGKAAATIVGRVEAACSSAVLHRQALASLDDGALRACGVSANKLLALRDLCRRAEAGQVPDARRLARMDDEAIIDALVAVRGIGRWTVQMLLIFRLGRPDVLAHDDLGIRKGLQRVDGLASMPTPGEVAAAGERWAPYRSLAGLYLWRIADGAGTG